MLEIRPYREYDQGAVVADRVTESSTAGRDIAASCRCGYSLAPATTRFGRIR